MAEVHCFTSASFAYLDRARILWETLRHHQPDWKLWLCLADREPPGFKFDPSRELIDGVVRLDELGIQDLDRWVFDHDIVELCTAVKGPMLCKLLEEGASKVIYLDPDIAVFSDLSEIESLLDRYDIILTPHQLEPDGDFQAIIDNEIGSLKHGIYNLGFIAVANTDHGRRFAYWWRDRLLRFCFDDIPNGLFTDQRWCDHVPVFFPTTHILRDPGYNVASWNQSRRPITIEKDGSVRAAGAILRFFHFTKITWAGQVMLERYSGGRSEVFELMKWYNSRLAANVVAGLPSNWWAFGRYSDGQVITRAHRSAYRADPRLRERFKRPFIARPGSFAEHTAAVVADGYAAFDIRPGGVCSFDHVRLSADEVILSGWAILSGDDAPADAVLLQLDVAGSSRRIVADRTVRPDVAASYKNDALKMSGFTAIAKRQAGMNVKLLQAFEGHLYVCPTEYVVPEGKGR
jgi:hypothetical protein